MNRPTPDASSNGEGAHAVVPVPGQPHSATGEISLVSVFTVLLRYRRMIIAIPLVLAAIAAISGLGQERTYSATAVFMPQGGGGGGSSSALSRQLGIDLGGGGGQSPDFYAALLTTRELLRDAVTAEYTYEDDGVVVTRTLADVWGGESADPEARRRAALGRLRGATGVRTQRNTGFVLVTVTAEEPRLAEQVADRLVQLVNQFNLERRQTQAAAELAFVRARMEAMQQELLESEEALKTFLRQNRQFENSPELAFEHERLQRDLALRQSIYSSLAQAHEQARIDRVRDTPVITMVESAVGSASLNQIETVRRAVIALLVGLVLAVLLAFLLEFLRRTREDDRPDSREFEELRRQAASDLRLPVRLIGRGRSTGARG